MSGGPSKDVIRIRNWSKWQSYRRDRGQPPWIKVHRALMRDPAWVELTDGQRGQLVCIWLLAADRDGVIPASPRLLRKLCHLDSDPDLQMLAGLGFLEPDANVTPKRRQRDQPETETETETETESATRARGVGIENLDPLVRRSIVGLYGDDNGTIGTDERIWGSIEQADRVRLLTIATLRWQAEGHTHFRSALFRKILQTVIGEQSSADDVEMPADWGLK